MMRYMPLVAAAAVAHGDAARRLLRPARFFSGSVSDFSGRSVISSNVETLMPRRPGEVGR